MHLRSRRVARALTEATGMGTDRANVRAAEALPADATLAEAMLADADGPTAAVLGAAGLVLRDAGNRFG